MSRNAVVYWSGTGNTEAMAKAVLSGIKESGAQAELFSVLEFDPATLPSYDAVAFGCPAMGAEELEDFEFAPVFENCKGSLKDKKIGLFGSYGWGDGQWMRSWEDSCRELGAVLAGESVICSGAPEASDIEKCNVLGRALA